jgi:hypothetical protein
VILFIAQIHSFKKKYSTESRACGLAHSYYYDKTAGFFKNLNGHVPRMGGY